MRADLIPHANASASPSDIKKAATSLEAFFLRQVLGSVRGADEGNAVFGGGFAGGMFHEMLDEAMADSMAKSGGVGLGKMIAADLVRGARPTPSTASVGAHQPAAPTVTPAAKAKPTSIHNHIPSAPKAVLSTEKPRAQSSLLSIAPAVHASRARRSYGDSSLASSAKAVVSSPELALPVAGKETSGFGRRIDPLDGKPSYHSGLDLVAPSGSKVGAAGAGVVMVAGSAGSYGNLVVVDHGGGLETRYAHLERTTVHAGDRVEAGQEVGLVGETGRTTGPHLHFEVRREGQAVDPKRVLAMAPKFTR